MCNIAGYVGKKRAAPILIEMSKREEGYDAGFYSGIATIHEGKIYYAKLTGDCSRLEKETNALSLPGTVGIIHGRTQSGGGDKWAHPFVTERDGEPVLAYVANGSAWIFKDRTEEYNALTETMLGEGYTMLSRDKGDCIRYQVLSDGSAVHMSDAMCQLIARHMDGGADEVTAMERAFCQMPSEIVGLLLSLGLPDGIAYSRINMPMFVGFCDHGAYIASTPTAFLADAGEPQALPARSSGILYRDGYTVVPYKNPTMVVEPITADIRHKAYETALAALQGEPKKFPDVRKEVQALFPQENCVPAALLTYEILYWLEKQGKLKVETTPVAGVKEGLTAPKTWLSLR
ncbi:MAG: hypothetical protein IJ317_03895 [Clostridia bacterium]|nr:hypothetical protein [Clostridia bacterium]